LISWSPGAFKKLGSRLLPSGLESQAGGDLETKLDLHCVGTILLMTPWESGESL